MRNKDEELLRLINEYNGDVKNNGYKISAELTWLIKLRSGDKMFHVYSLRSSDQAIAEIGGGGSYYLYNAWLYNNTNLGTDGNITFVNNSDGYSNENVRALDELYRTAQTLLHNNYDFMIAVQQALLQHETLLGSDIAYIRNQFN